jgi:hypothetical protein
MHELRDWTHFEGDVHEKSVVSEGVGKVCESRVWAANECFLKDGAGKLVL